MGRSEGGEGGEEEGEGRADTHVVVKIRYTFITCNKRDGRKRYI